MSLSDPALRPWNRKDVRLRAAWVCWALGAIGLFVLGFATAAELSEHSLDNLPVQVSVPIGLAGLALLGIGIVLAILSATHEQFSPWWIVVPMTLICLALGGSDLAHGLLYGTGVSVNAVAFCTAAVLTPVCTAILVRRHSRLTARTHQVTRQGTRASARVTSARSYSLNHREVTKVTVRFTDQQRRRRFVSGTVSGLRRIGDQIEVRYLPDPGKGSATIID